jgi:hypothetical protein
MMENLTLTENHQSQRKPTEFYKLNQPATLPKTSAPISRACTTDQQLCQKQPPQPFKTNADRHPTEKP